MLIDLPIAHCNVPSKVGAANWARCWHAAASQAPVFGLNEAFLSKATYARLARANNHGIAGLAKSPNPVFWDRKKIKRVTGKVHRLHARGDSVLAQRYPGLNDARYATDVTLRDRATGVEFGVVCTHWVVGPGRKLPKAWQVWARREAKKGVRRLVRAHQRAGRPVWVIGDTNVRVPLAPLRVRFRWVKNHDIDKSGLGLPAGARLLSSSWRNFAAPTDHKDGGVRSTAKIRITQRKAA